MNYASEDHGQPFPLVSNELGAVTVCACGVITLNLQYLSLRLEAPAFRELQQLLASAQRRLDHATAEAPAPQPARRPVH